VHFYKDKCEDLSEGVYNRSFLGQDAEQRSNSRGGQINFNSPNKKVMLNKKDK